MVHYTQFSDGLIWSLEWYPKRNVFEDKMYGSFKWCR